MSTINYKRLLLTSAIAMATAQTASAQVLEEIVVSGTKDAALAQDIPMSIAAVSGDALASGGLNDLTDLSASVPSFTVAEGLSGNVITMRGMGSASGERSFEQSVGMFVDGVYMPRSRQYFNAFLDVERVEILRGPQAVLFGLNSTAGAVNIITKSNLAGDPLEVTVTAAHELENSSDEITVAIGGGLSDSLGARLVIKHADNGSDTEIASGGSEGQNRRTSSRLSLEWNASENLLVGAKFDYNESEKTGNPFEQFNPTGAGCLDGPVAQGSDCKEMDRILDYDGAGLALVGGDVPGMKAHGYNAVIDLEYEMGEHTLAAIAAYSEFKNTIQSDLDSTTLTIFDSLAQENYDQTSLEVRLNSPGDEFVDYIVGAYYQTSDLEDQANNALIALLRGDNKLIVDQELYSVFATTTFNISDTFRVIAGARYNDETKDSSRNPSCSDPFNILGAGLTDSALTCVVLDSLGAPYSTLAPNFALDPKNAEEITSTNFMPELVVQWEYSDSSQLFARVGKSAKSGGMTTATNPVDVNQLTFDDESVIGFEVGIKSRLADGAGELNITAFRSEFDDLQVTAFDNAGNSSIGNAGESYTQGIEIDGRWAVNDWLILGGSIAYLDAEFTEYANGKCNDSGPGGSSTTTENPGGASCDLDGEALPYAADITSNLYADILFSLTDSLDLVAGTSISYSDDYVTEGSIDPQLGQDSYTRVDARIGVAASDDSWEVSVIGKNLTDENVQGHAQKFSGTAFGYLGAPRLVSIQGIYRFGQ